MKEGSIVEIGSRVKAVRKYCGLNQSEFGLRVGLTPSGVSKLETGDRGYSDAIFLAIVREFGVDENWLRTGEGEMFRPVPQLPEQGGPVDMKDRLKAIRERACLTQYAFGSRIGVTGATISRLESGDRSLTEAQILTIAREFGVDENWLRTGKGTMLRPAARSAGPSAPFCRLISVLPSLTADEWAILERKVKEFLVEIQKDGF